MPSAMADQPLSVPPYQLHRPDGPVGPLIAASPHSGRHYPADLLAASRLDGLTLRRSEDAFIDDLISFAPQLGIALLTAQVARAYIDLNREPYELDPGMFADDLPAHARRASDRLAAGLGAVPRVVGLGLDIYARKLQLAEAESRIDQVHRPYHQALSGLLEDTVSHCGYAVLLDCHSMPSLAPGRAQGGWRGPAEIVLGDRNGLACHPALTALLRAGFEAQGLRVAVNDPYAGGYTTQRYGVPAQCRHVIQIEIDRGLYMDELTIARRDGFAPLQQALRETFAAFFEALPSLGLAGSLPLAAE
jgi:N-formylglutamate amidohydrolase